MLEALARKLVIVKTMLISSSIQMHGVNRVSGSSSPPAQRFQCDPDPPVSAPPARASHRALDLSSPGQRTWLSGGQLVSWVPPSPRPPDTAALPLETQAPSRAAGMLSALAPPMDAPQEAGNVFCSRRAQQPVFQLHCASLSQFLSSGDTGGIKKGGRGRRWSRWSGTQWPSGGRQPRSASCPPHRPGFASKLG